MAVRHAVQVFAAAERRHRRNYQQDGDSLSLNYLQALFLLLNQGEATTGQLAAAAELKPGSATTMIDQLEQRGLVTRRRDPGDGRTTLVSLTARGRREVEENETQWRQRLAMLFDDMSDADLLAASEVLQRLAALLSQSASRQAGRPSA
jgi:DNA-binding MarR family transcriptional regulator